MFSEATRVQIRKYMGFGNIYLQQDPRLENAISSLQQVPNGVQPTADAETEVLNILTQLQQVDTAILNLSNQQGVLAANNGVRLNSAMETFRLQGVGRMYVGRLARMLDTFPRSDAFAPAGILTESQGGTRSPYAGGGPAT